MNWINLSNKGRYQRNGHNFVVIPELFHFLVPIIQSIAFLCTPSDQPCLYRSYFSCWKPGLAMETSLDWQKLINLSCFLSVSKGTLSNSVFLLNISNLDIPVSNLKWHILLSCSLHQIELDHYTPQLHLLLHQQLEHKGGQSSY